VAEKIMIAPVVHAMLWSEQLSQQQHQILSEFQPSGDVEEVKLNWQDAQHWEVGLHLNNLSFQNTTDVPGVNNLSGSLMANPSLAKIHIDSENTTIYDPSLFANPLLFQEMSGVINAQYDGQLWEFKTDSFLLENDDLKIDSQFTLKGGNAQDTHIDAKMVIPKMNSTHLYHYLPIHALTPDLAVWFGHSMQKGEFQDIVLTTDGLIKDFPFYDQGTGHFRLALDINDLSLLFDPDWPMIEKIDGQFLFVDRHIDIVLNKATTYDMDLLGVSCEITVPKEGTSWLDIHGETLMSVSHGVDYINATPLAKTLGKNLSAFTFDMPATLTLDLKVPLDNPNEEIKVNGAMQISEGEALLNDLKLKFTQINGVFGFTEYGMETTGIHAQLLGHPAILTVSPELKNGHHLSHWQLTGHATMTNVATIFPSSLWEYVKGESDFVASFVTDNDSIEHGFDLSIASDLTGTEILLPEPLGKTIEKAVPIRLTTSVDKPEEVIRLEYANLVDGVARLQKKEDKTVLSGAKIQLGSELKNFETPTGIVVTGNIPQFSYDVWDDFMDTTHQDPHEANTVHAYDDLIKQIKEVDVTINELDALHYPFTQAQVVLTQNSDKWFLNINSKELKGRVTIPQTDAAGILILDFDYCNWNNNLHYEEQNDLMPQHLQALNFSCQDFVYNQKSLGTLKFSLQPEGTSTLKINHLSMTRANDKFTADGKWWVENNQQQSSFTGHLSSKALDKTMALFDIKPTILDSDAESDFTLSWPSDPFDFDLATLNGHISVHLSNGRIIDVNPGFGRILSLLSIQELGRRLRLNFSDVFKKGFSFDDITADLNIKNGIAHSDNLKMTAPAADMEMKGNVNLGTKALDLNANVRINITGSLPIAATIASGGNPIVGAVGVGVWAVDKIVKSQGGNLLASSYHVTGTWENPKVNGK
jgi:uncharacterized protein (TIGR02099 family)